MNRVRHLRHALIPAAWVLGVGWALWSGRDPGYWAAFDPATYYPWREVLLACAIVTAECLALLVILRPWSYRRHWRRALAASAMWFVLVGWELAHAMTDQPGYAYVNYGFVTLVFPVLLVLTLVSWMAAVVERERAKGLT